MAGGQLGGVIESSVKLGIVAAVIVVGGAHGERGIGGAVILACDGALVAVGYEVGLDAVEVVEAAVVVKLSGEHECLTLGRAADVLHARAEIVAKLGYVGYNVLAAVVAP